MNAHLSLFREWGMPAQECDAFFGIEDDDRCGKRAYPYHDKHRPMVMRFIILTLTERSPLKNITRRIIHCVYHYITPADGKYDDDKYEVFQWLLSIAGDLTFRSLVQYALQEWYQVDDYAPLFFHCSGWPGNGFNH